jgi:hypothetical protein
MFDVALEVKLHVAARANAFLQAANFGAQGSFDAFGSTLASSYAADVRGIDSEVAGYTAVETAIEADPIKRVNDVSVVYQIHLSRHKSHSWTKYQEPEIARARKSASPYRYLQECLALLGAQD